MNSPNAFYQRCGIAIVLLHALVSVAHGAAHSALNISMSDWQNLYILLVIFLLPLVAGLLLWRGARTGFHILFLSMLGSLLFGGYYHFVLSGPDNVNSLLVHRWTLPFQICAVLLALIEAAGAIVGIAGILQRPDNKPMGR